MDKAGCQGSEFPDPPPKDGRVGQELRHGIFPEGEQAWPDRAHQADTWTGYQPVGFSGEEIEREGGHFVRGARWNEKSNIFLYWNGSGTD